MTRRAVVVAAHSLDHFSLTVPDLAEAATFYERFGLEIKPDGNALELFAAASPHRRGRYHAGPSEVLDYLSLGIYADDLPAFRKRLADCNVAIVAAPPQALDERPRTFSHILIFTTDVEGAVDFYSAIVSLPSQTPQRMSSPSCTVSTAAIIIIDYVPAGGNWQARRVSPEIGFYLWGPAQRRFCLQLRVVRRQPQQRPALKPPIV